MAEKDEKRDDGYLRTTLETIAGGTLPEKFQYELDRVLRNIDDVNADAKTKRTITIELTFKPDASRQAVAVVASVKSKIVAPDAGEGVLFMVRDGKGDPFGVDANPHQPELFRS